MAFLLALRLMAKFLGRTIMGLSLIAVFMVQVDAEALDEDMDIPMPKLLPNMLLGSDTEVGLRRWLTDLLIEVPGGSSMEMPGMGDLDVRRGTCWGLTVDSVEVQDNSSGLQLEFGVRLIGLGIQCSLEGYSNGTVYLNLTVARSSLNATIQIHPHYSEIAPQFPMPFGHFNMTNCVPALDISDATFNGTSEVVNVTHMLPKSTLLLSMQGFAQQEMCSALKDLIETNGTESLRLAGTLVAPLLLPPLAPLQANVLRPAMDWATWPPTAVLKALVRERFSVWVGRAVKILDMHDFRLRLVETKNVSLDLRQLHISGVGPQHRPGLELVAQNETLGVFADLPGLVVDAVLVFSVFLPDQPILTEVIRVRVGLNNVTVLSRSIVDADSLDELNPEKMAESPKCLVSCTDGMTDPQSDSIIITDLDANIRPLLEIAAYGQIEHDITHSINVVLRALFHGYMPTVNALARGGLGLARMPMNDALWKKIDTLAPCDLGAMDLAGVDQAAVDIIPVVALGVLIVGVIASLLAMFVAVKRCPAEQTGNEAVMTTSNIALACEPVVPLAIRVFYPFAVVTVMCIFFYADLGLGATVNMNMEANGETAIIGPVFSFSLISTIADAWTCGSWAISVLTLVMSGLWPHIKLLMLLAAWVVPPHRLSMNTRGRVLAFLDTWGKYGFLESWFLVFSISAFAVDWHSVGEDSSIQVLTTPRSAFWAFFIATVLSLLLGHTASEYNSYAIRRRSKAIAAQRKARAAADAEAEAPAGQQAPAAESGDATAQMKAANSDRSVESPSDATISDDTTECEEGQKACKDYSPLRKHIGKKSRLVVFCGLAASYVLMIWGSLVTSFDFSISGMFIEFLLSKPVEKDYSLLSVGGSISSGRYSDSGLPVLEVMFFFLVIVIPLSLLTALVTLWLVPMSLKSQRCVLHACRVLDAWACLDVAALVLIIAIMQFGMMAEFLASKGSLGAPCKLIKNIAKEECFAIGMSAHAGVAPLLLAGVALLVVPKVAMRLSEDAIDHKKAGLTDFGDHSAREQACDKSAVAA
mmetsp:Transcript_70559/g.204610  ORF Transcript_70559/g.204610 Transcript_70559/m.204610 type:complete len:1041 (-) Transcript_70559:104-3226(-)